MHKIGKQTVCFDNPPVILQTASIVGPKEANGPMASYFDTVSYTHLTLPTILRV